MIICILLISLTGDKNIVNIATQSIYDSLTLCLHLAVIYIFWCGILEIMQDTGINSKLSRILSPIIKKLFPNIHPKTQESISINISANMLGLGNASLPAGLKAMRELNQNNSKIGIDKNTALFVCINCISIQLLPSTVISLYLNSGGTSASFIILSNIIISAIVFLTCVFIINMFYIKQTKKLKNKKAIK